MEDLKSVCHVMSPIFHETKRSPFGLYDTCYSQYIELQHLPYIKEVPMEVSHLMYASIEYPPAFALAQREIHKSDLSESITQEEFNKIIIKVFHKYLERQWKDHYILAKVAVPKGVERHVGEFHWVLDYTPQIKVVSYIDHDKFIDSDHVSCFRLTEEQIAYLPVIERKKYSIYDRVNKRKAEFDLTDESLNFDEISELIRTIR